MGNNTKKKVRSLPPLGKESKSKGKKKPEVGLEHNLNHTLIIRKRRKEIRNHTKSVTQINTNKKELIQYFFLPGTRCSDSRPSAPDWLPRPAVHEKQNQTTENFQKGQRNCPWTDIANYFVNFSPVPPRSSPPSPSPPARTTLMMTRMMTGAWSRKIPSLTLARW